MCCFGSVLRSIRIMGQIEESSTLDHIIKGEFCTGMV